MATVRHVPKATMYTHTDTISLAQRVEIQASLARAAETGKSFTETPKPLKVCVTCGGNGYVPGGAGSCPGCSGMKTVEYTTEEIRTAYKDVRNRALLKKGVTCAMFDEACRNVLKGNDPQDWLAAAHEIEKRTR